MKLGKWLALGLLMASAVDSRAQSPVLTQPGQANSGEGSGTLAATDTFQLIWASARNPTSIGSLGYRNGCLVLNNSTHTEWVYFQGPGMDTPNASNAAAIKAKSIPLTAATVANTLGGYVNCITGAGQALQDAVWIAGTQNDTFVAKQQ